jgi:L-ascorbate metabolism protein UlaG (beta-lactamase superfamily)
VPTNIRDYAGGTIYDANSIFIFEVGSLCIAHLGHLHHELQPVHLEAMGPIDVVLVAVDGAYTIDQPGMVKIMRTIGAPLVIPMHYFGPATLARFLDLAGKHYRVVTSESAHVVLSRATLPKEPTLLVLPGH